MLIEKAKAFLQQSQSGKLLLGYSGELYSTLYPQPAYVDVDEFDLRTIQAVSALLLNAKEYNALTSREQPFVPGRVFPRLAIALATLEKEEPMRKPIRDLFEAGKRPLWVDKRPLWAGKRPLWAGKRPHGLVRDLYGLVRDLMGW